MATPKVTIKIQDGGLGRTNAGSDGVAILLLPVLAASYTDITLLGAFYSFQDFKQETNLVTPGTAFSVNHIAEGQVFDFYQESGNGAKLYTLVYPVDGDNATTGEQAVLAAQPILENELNGEVKIAGVAYATDNANYVNGIPTALFDGTSGVATATKTVASYLETAHMPLHFLVEAKEALLSSAATENMRAIDNRYATPVFGRKTGYEAIGSFDYDAETKPNNYYSPVGAVLGRLAKIKVNRNPGAVKDGSLNSTYLEQGTQGGGIGGYLDKGYLVFRQFPGLPGWRIADSPTMTNVSSDFAYIELNRTINKVHRLAYITYVQELLSDVTVDQETGFIDETTIKHFEGLIEMVIETQMISKQELSGIKVYIDPKQNILATNILNINLKVIPTGVLREIIVNIGFENPFKY